MYQTIELEHQDGVSSVTLNRPPLNLITMTMLEELQAAFNLLEARRETRALLLVGKGPRAFCAGADLTQEVRAHALGRPRFPRGGPARGRAHRELPQAGRLRRARLVHRRRHRARLAGRHPHRVLDGQVSRAGDVYLGLIPTWSVGMVRLVHYIGRNRTLDLLMLGRDIDAGRALELGLVSMVVPDDAFERETAAVMQRLASGAPLPFQAIKEAVRAQARDGLDRATLLEEEWSQRILASSDAHEGMTAFLEKRKPKFRGE